MSLSRWQSSSGEVLTITIEDIDYGLLQTLKGLYDYVRYYQSGGTVKIFIQDNGWCGCIVVVAENIEKAREFMFHEINFSDNPIDEHPIVSGFVFSNLGDM